MTTRFLRLGLFGSLIALLAVGFIFFDTTAQAQQEDKTTDATVVTGGVAPIIECKWELRDLQVGIIDSSFPNGVIQYEDSVGNANDDDSSRVPDADDDSGNGTQIPCTGPENGRRKLVIGSLALAAIAHGLFNVAVFAIDDLALGLLVSALLVGFGGFWAHRAFRRGQLNSPFRFKKNYPLVECPSCRLPIRALHRFCAYCGTTVPATFESLICGHYRTRNRPDASFCTSCGDQLLTR